MIMFLWLMAEAAKDFNIKIFFYHGRQIANKTSLKNVSIGDLSL
jgi:hypothetical protein